MVLLLLLRSTVPNAAACFMWRHGGHGFQVSRQDEGWSSTRTARFFSHRPSAEQCAGELQDSKPCHNNVSGPCEFTKTLSRLRERGREFSKESKHACKLYCFIHHISFHLPRRGTRETRKREATKVAVPRSCDDNATHRAIPWSFPWWLVGLREFPHGEHRVDSLFHCLSPFTFDRQIGRFSRNSHFPTCTPACVPNAHVTYSTHSHISSR